MHFNGDFRGFADSERRIISTYKSQAESWVLEGTSLLCACQRMQLRQKYQKIPKDLSKQSVSQLKSASHFSRKQNKKKSLLHPWIDYT